MSGQQIDQYSAWHAPPSTSTVTGTSELFGSTYAMLSDNATYPDHWASKQVTQSILFEQPQIQPLVGNSFDPPVRFDPPYAYRANNYMSSVPALTAAAAAQQYYPARTAGYTQPFYSPVAGAMAMPNTQQLLLAAQAAQASQQQVVRPEPLRPAVATAAPIKNGNGNHFGSNGVHRSTSNSSAETMRHNSSTTTTVSPSDDVSSAFKNT